MNTVKVAGFHSWQLHLSFKPFAIEKHMDSKVQIKSLISSCYWSANHWTTCSCDYNQESSSQLQCIQYYKQKQS